MAVVVVLGRVRLVEWFVTVGGDACCGCVGERLSRLEHCLLFDSC